MYVKLLTRTLFQVDSYFDNVVEDLEPTGIHSVTLDKETGNKAIYDLNGRRIQNVPSRGIYIQNGKKISVK